MTVWKYIMKMSAEYELIHISHYRPGVKNTIKSITINILNKGFVI